MTYLMHFYVDPITGEAFEENRQAPNGKSHPNIPSLDVKYWFKNQNGVDYCLSVTDASFDSSVIKGVTVLTEEDWFEVIKVEFEKSKQAKIKEVFDYVIEIKHLIIDSWWHSSEIAAGVGIKVAEAKFVLEAPDEATAIAGAPILAAEAHTRKISITDLATRISMHSTKLGMLEAVISGHRGFITDQIDAIQFVATMEGSNQSFANISKFTGNDNSGEGVINYKESFKEVLAQYGVNI
jgi:hypothetical protein